MTDKEAMKLALEALQANQPVNYCVNNNGEKFQVFSNDPLRQERNEKAITALKEALAQPEQTEVQRLIALVRAQQITIDKLEMALKENHEHRG
jgi:hypothetical protein